jgi:hypothetical protein
MPSWPPPHQKNTPPGNITSKGNENKTPLMPNMYASKYVVPRGVSHLVVAGFEPDLGISPLIFVIQSLVIS